MCFIGKVKLPDFLQQQLKPKTGNVVEVPAESEVFKNGFAKEDLESITQKFHYVPEAGAVIGEHKGAHYYTVGQRKGLGIGGTPEPLFVLETDTKTNTIYTGQGENHPGLYRKGLKILNNDVHWIREDLKMQTGESREYDFRFRYRQELFKATLTQTEEALYVLFETPQRGIAAGQFAAWYDGEELLGSGVID